jgi:hypothetical protein
MRHQGPFIVTLSDSEGSKLLAFLDVLSPRYFRFLAALGMTRAVACLCLAVGRSVFTHAWRQTGNVENEKTLHES